MSDELELEREYEVAPGRADLELEEMADGWQPVTWARYADDEVPTVINEWGEYALPRPGDGTVEGQLVGTFRRLGLSEHGAQLAARGR